MAMTMRARIEDLLIAVCLTGLLGAAGCAGAPVPDCGAPPKPSCNTTPAPTTVNCTLDRDECISVDDNQTTCTQFIHRHDTDVPACGVNLSDKQNCDQLCAGNDQNTHRIGGFKNCTTMAQLNPAPPSTMCRASGLTIAPAEYDSITCTKTGRLCNLFDEASNCFSLSSLQTITVTDPCVDLQAQSAFDTCLRATNSDGSPLNTAVVKVTAYQRNVTCPAHAAPVPPLDRTFGLATGTTINTAIGGSSTPFTTKGGRAIVTYACDSTGEFCNPQYLKEFQLDLNDRNIVVGGITYPFTNIKLVSSAPIPVLSGNRLSTTGPGFDLSGKMYGIIMKNHINPQSTVQLTGSYTGTNFGISTSISMDIATLAGFTHISGSANVSGSPGGVQINCGNNGAIPPFIADTDFSGGAGKTRTNNIDLSGATNPAPMTVYQSQHYASPFTYTIPGFTAGSNHLIRLHFAETNPLNNAPNKRKFSVAINGTTRISNLDLFATVGMNKAYIQEFTLPADSSGRYVLSFTASLDSATISAIEVM